MASRTSIQQTAMRLTHAMNSGAGAEQVDACKAALAAEKIAYHVEKTLADAPSLTDEQRARIGNLLTGSVDR